MGMHSYVVGFKPPDDTWRKMKAIYDACDEAGIDPPNEVENYFDGEPPDEHGVEVPQDRLPVTDWTDGDMREGFEVDVTKLPDGVKVIRFINSY